MKKSIKLLLILCSYSILSIGQNFHNTVDKIYNFNPAELNDEQRISVSASLDSIWSLVKNDTTTYLKELRNELSDSTHNSFFYFDGSNLLLSLSNSQSDLRLISNAILKCELDGISHYDYLSMGLMLSYYKTNTIEIAKKILNMDEFKPFIMQHAMYWEKDMCLVWLLHQLDDNMYVNDIIPSFNSVNNDSKMAIISYCYYTCSCEGDRFIKECSSNMNIEQSIRDHAIVLTKMIDIKKKDNPEKYKELIAERKKLLMGIGDEVLNEFIKQTQEIKKEYTCP